VANQIKNVCDLRIDWLLDTRGSGSDSTGNRRPQVTTRHALQTQPHEINNRPSAQVANVTDTINIHRERESASTAANTKTLHSDASPSANKILWIRQSKKVAAAILKNRNILISAQPINQF